MYVSTCIYTYRVHAIRLPGLARKTRLRYSQHISYESSISSSIHVATKCVTSSSIDPTLVHDLRLPMMLLPTRSAGRAALRRANWSCAAAAAAAAASRPQHLSTCWQRWQPRGSPGSRPYSLPASEETLKSLPNIEASKLDVTTVETPKPLLPADKLVFGHTFTGTRASARWSRLAIEENDH